MENECIKYSSSKTKDIHAHKLKFSKVCFDGHSAYLTVTGLSCLPVSPFKIVRCSRHKAG